MNKLIGGKSLSHLNRLNLSSLKESSQNTVDSLETFGTKFPNKIISNFLK